MADCKNGTHSRMLRQPPSMLDKLQQCRDRTESQAVLEGVEKPPNCIVCWKKTGDSSNNVWTSVHGAYRCAWVDDAAQDVSGYAREGVHGNEFLLPQYILHLLSQSRQQRGATMTTRSKGRKNSYPTYEKERTSGV